MSIPAFIAILIASFLVAATLSLSCNLLISSQSVRITPSKPNSSLSNVVRMYLSA